MVGGLGSYEWGLALALSLTAGAAISYVLLAFSSQEAFEVNLGPGQRRAFKGGELTFPLVFASPEEEMRTHLELARVPDGAEARLQPGGEHGTALVVRSVFSGVFSGFALKVGILDPVGLFSRYEERMLDLDAEFLPTSLLSKREKVLVSAAMLGDRPAGSRGSGQEFYSAELYDSSHDSKGILWKRQAMTEGDNLMVRVGEANIPESLTVCLLEAHRRTLKELPGWMDLASEAVSLIGLKTLDSGSSLRVIHQIEGVATVAEARDLRELAELLVGLWRDGVAKRIAAVTPAEASIIMTGEEEMQNPAIFGLLLRKPSVVLSYTTQRVAQGTRVVFFTGKESVSELVSGVLSR